ncbi:WG repeat-containing protein [Flammeovirga aprica]|uniref:WG repeat-containing protein n=1 Tax=Flammeovirga aprica JL-4 TaxID=694437 RepID=A0A7X9P2X5_9BACT|nr:WG repeat-containing protein [Flammeovirga aprica]NME68576.1 WG repeat-containing protein [Flammeovirga aprica JL-4]
MRTLTFILLLSPLFCFSQHLVPVAKNGKWGFQGNSDTTYPYQFITPVEEHKVFKIGQAYKIGVVDLSGNTLLPCDYNRVEVVSDQLYVVWNEKGATLVDKQNAKLTTEYYDHISPFGMYLKVTLKRKEGIIKKDGEVICKPIYDKINLLEDNPVFVVQNGDKKGIIDLKGQEPLPIEYKDIKAVANKQLLATYPNTPLVSFILINEDGSLKNKKDFNKQADFTAFQKRFYFNYLKKDFSKSGATAPQWLEIMGDHYLVAPNGKELLDGRNFFYVQQNENNNLTIARREEKDGTLKYYLIDHQEGKILFSDSFKDIVFADFGESNWARISVDTLWDCLINKEGDVKRVIEADGMNYSMRDIGNFYEGFAFYHSNNNNSYGFIDTNGESVIPPIYTLASDFKEGYSIVKKNGKFGAINTQGKIVIPISYDGISLCEKGWFRVKQGSGISGKWGVVNTSGKAVLECKYQEIQLDDKGANVKLNGAWGRYLRSYEWAFTPKVKVSKIHAFNNGIAKMERKPIYDPVDRKTIRGYKYQGFIKEDGKVIIPPVYTSVIGFQRAWDKQEGLAIINKNKLHGFVNYLGEVVLDANFISTGNFTEVWTIHKGIAKVTDKEGLTSFVDSNGKEVLPFEFTSISDNYEKIWNDSNGVAIAQLNGKKGLIDFEGKKVSPFVYPKLFQVNEQLFVGQVPDKEWGMINQAGDTTVNFSYSKALPLSSKYSQLIQDTTLMYTLLNNGQWSNEVIEHKTENSASIQQNEDYTYHHIGEDYAIVSKKGKSKLQGVVDHKGKVIIKPSFKKILPFSDGIAVAQKEGKSAKDRKYGFIDKKGKWIIPATYNNAQSFADGLAAVCMKNKWGYIDQNNKVIIPIQYSKASNFNNTIAVVNQTSIINKEGKIQGSISSTENIKEVNENHIIVKGIGYEKHLSINGIHLYDMDFDEVTAFNSAGIAFVKTGEQWLLKRTINEVKVTKLFTKSEKEIYENKYGRHRKVVSLTGDVTEDHGFEKIKDGQWRMIGLDSQPLNNISFYNVKKHNDGSFTFEIKNVGKVTNAKGEIITEDFIQSTQLFGDGLLIYNEGNAEFIQ